MGDGPIQPVIQPIPIETMLNNKGLNIGDGLNFITCEGSLRYWNSGSTDITSKYMDTY